MLGTLKNKAENAITKDDAPQTLYLYERLLQIYSHTKKIPVDTPQQHIDELIYTTKRVGQ